MNIPPNEWLHPDPKHGELWRRYALSYRLSHRDRFTLIASLIWLVSSIGFLPVILRFFTVQFVNDCPPPDYPPGSVYLKIDTCLLFTRVNAFINSFTPEQMALLAIFAAVWLMVWVMLQPYWTTEATQ